MYDPFLTNFQTVFNVIVFEVHELTDVLIVLCYALEITSIMTKKPHENTIIVNHCKYMYTMKNTMHAREAAHSPL